MNRLLLTAIAATLGVAANAQFLMDQIGPDNTGQTGQTVHASQDFNGAFPTFDVNAIDDFTIGAAANITAVEAVMGMYNSVNINFANVLGYRIEVYSSVAAGASNLVGDVASVAVAPANAVVDTSWLGGTNIVSKVSMSGLNINIGSAGTYWVGVMAVQDFALHGQVGVSGSTVGTGNDMWQVNPGGGFGLGTSFQPVIPTNAAYRVTGTLVPEPGTFIAIGVGLAALALRRRSK
ncbi:MAG: PEP-CTERM sorting domain-containing protein [Armatimonadota bacterium]|nr:PEP-CTERM sorting domain-containing protein [Armatimonadota bacterium]